MKLPKDFLKMVKDKSVIANTFCVDGKTSWFFSPDTHYANTLDYIAESRLNLTYGQVQMFLKMTEEEKAEMKKLIRIKQLKNELAELEK